MLGCGYATSRDVFMDSGSGEGLEAFLEVALVHRHLTGKRLDRQLFVVVRVHDIPGLEDFLPFPLMSQEAAGRYRTSCERMAELLYRPAQQVNGKLQLLQRN